MCIAQMTCNLLSPINYENPTSNQMKLKSYYRFVDCIIVRSLYNRRWWKFETACIITYGRFVILNLKAGAMKALPGYFFSFPDTHIS